MPIFISAEHCFLEPDFGTADADGLGLILADRSMCDAAVMAVRYGWTGTVCGYFESEWSTARDLMLAGF